MSFGLYIHIPYCLQRCLYCDFATYEVNTTLNPNSYFRLLKKEIQQRHSKIPYRKLSSVYFGGGTPSLVNPQLIIDLLNELVNLGFILDEKTEVTIEINPGTTFNEKIQDYLKSPINRYSVGAQTFNDTQLKKCGRKHNAADTHQTLGLLKKYKLNFSLDILYALPGQSLKDLENDLDIGLSFLPKHSSPYYLTVPKGHILNKNRPSEGSQVEMFHLIKDRLEENSFNQYEISNFSLKGYESRHNMIYWSDQPYWGIGLSAHSYFPQHNLRFWNPKAMTPYQKLINSENDSFSLNQLHTSSLFKGSYEYLKENEQMTDFCHTHLRKNSGIPKAALRKKFASKTVKIIVDKLDQLTNNKLIEESSSHWYFSLKGQNISNLVFEQLCFSKDEISLSN